MPHNKKESPAASSKAGVTRRGGFRKPGGPPAAVTPAASLPPLSPSELLQEKLEARRLRDCWDAGRIPSTLKGS